jgi:hypothetical protein
MNRLSLLRDIVAKKRLVLVETTADPVPAKVWHECVAEAKGVLSLMRQHRFRIAELAMRACGVTPCKRHSVGLDKKRELRRFANEVGVHPATLSEWVIIKKNIIDQIKPTDFDPDNYMALLRTKRRIKTRTPPEQIVRIYQEESTRNPVELKIEAIHRRFLTVHSTFYKIRLDKVDPEKLRDIARWCTNIVEQINVVLSKRESA